MDSKKLNQKFSKGFFDRILLDAPCSAEGRINLDNEKTFGFWTLENIKNKQILQLELIESIIPLLKTA
jgi:16S rRNA C967 or C1407 C5-methylase (RsmB/RsmF family)